MGYKQFFIFFAVTFMINLILTVLRDGRMCKHWDYFSKKYGDKYLEDTHYGNLMLIIYSFCPGFAFAFIILNIILLFNMLIFKKI